MKLLKSFGFLALGLTIAMGACGGGGGGGGKGGKGGGGEAGEGGEGGDGGNSEGGSGGKAGSGSAGSGSAGSGSAGSGSAGSGSAGSGSAGSGSAGSGSAGSGSAGSGMAGSGAAGSAPAGLIGSWSFDEGSGSMAKDSSGSNNNGKIVKGTTADAPMNGSPKWVAGKKGMALQLDGSSEWVNVPQSASVDSTAEQQAVTVAGWVKLSSFAMGDKPWSWLISRHAIGTAYEQFGLGVVNGAPACSIYFTPAVATQPIPVDTWVHLAMTYDNLTCHVYQNGTEVTSGDIGYPIGAQGEEVVIGGNQNLEVIKEFMNGVVDEVKLYNKVLDAAAIKELATAN